MFVWLLGVWNTDRLHCTLANRRRAEQLKRSGVVDTDRRSLVKHHEVVDGLPAARGRAPPISRHKSLPNRHFIPSLKAKGEILFNDIQIYAIKDIMLHKS